MLEQVYRQLVMDHYKHPRNQGKLEQPETIRLSYKNPTCGDTVVLYTLIDKDRIVDLKFEGIGCSISMASCSMMTAAIKSKSVEQAETLIKSFNQLIKVGEVDEEQMDDLEDAVSLSGVHQLKARHNCALMAWNALGKALESHHSKQAEAGEALS